MEQKQHEVRFLIKRAERYLRSARLLLIDGDYESCVSRTYYAMFYAAEAALLTKGLSFSSHKGVISEFGKQFVKTSIFPKEAGRVLNKIFEKREISDYSYTFTISRSEATKVLKEGTWFVKLVSSYIERVVHEQKNKTSFKLHRHT